LREVGEFLAPVQPCTITVNPESSIQEVIESAPKGAVICLAEGVWWENIVIRKSLTLRGVSPQKSAIKGMKEDEPVILIKSGNVTIEGLTIAEAKGADYSRPRRPNGISICGKAQAIIENTIILRNESGICMWGSSQAIIKNSTISRNSRGLWMKGSSQATVENTAILGNEQDSIWMWGSSRITIKNSIISRNLGYGVLMDSYSQAMISDSTISGNSCGLWMRESAQAMVRNSTISENRGLGMWAEDSSQAVIENNVFKSNQVCSIYARPGTKVTGSSNHFKDNGVDLCGNAPACLRIPLAPQTAKMEISFPGEYPTLQHAIDAVAPRGTIIIEVGEHQGGLTIWKPLILKGSGKLQGRTDKAPVISIIAEAKEVQIEGLEIERGKGILLYGSAMIKNSKISKNNNSGIEMGGSSQTVVENSTIAENKGAGVVLWDSSQITISGSTILRNWCEGMCVNNSSQATISKSVISENRDFGIWMRGASQAIIESAVISGNGTGISLWFSSQVTIKNSTISENGVGIWMRDFARATIKDNKIFKNRKYGIALCQRPCFATDQKFVGAIRGSGNDIRDNPEGDVCPADLQFLMTATGGYYWLGARSN
jgi:parallel beta-helix repeat protein